MKPRSNSVLKNLSPKKQAQVWKWLAGDAQKDLAPLSQRKVIAKIKSAWGIKVSACQLSGFYAWYPFSQRLLGAKNFSKDIEEYMLLHPDLDIDSQQVTKLAQLVFEKRSIDSEDAKLYVELRKLRQKDLELSLTREKFEIMSCRAFLQWYHDQKVRAIESSAMNNAEKISRLRKIFFADVDALRKSGAVRLPRE